MTGDSGARTGRSRSFVGSVEPDDGAPRPREVAVSAGLGGFAAVVLLVVSVVVPGSGRHEATSVRPITQGDGPVEVVPISPGAVASPELDEPDPASAAPTRLMIPLGGNAASRAAGAPFAARAVVPTTEPASAAARDGESVEVGASVGAGAPVAAGISTEAGASVPAAVPTPVASPSVAPEPASTAGAAELTNATASSSPASPQPGPTPSCRDDSGLFGSLLRSLGFGTCST